MERGRPQRPLGGSPGPVRDLAAALRALRAAAGNPSYKIMAATAHFAPATLARAASGQQLPSREVAVAYAAACGGDREEWDRRWLACAQQMAQKRAGAPPGDSASVTDESGRPSQADPERVDDPPARRVRRRVGRGVMVSAALVFVLVAALLVIGAPSRAPGPADPGAERGTAQDTTSAQALGSACAPQGIIAPRPTAGPLGAVATRVRVTFEGGFETKRDGWGPYWHPQNLVENLTTGHAFDGTQSLQVRVTGGFAAIGTVYLQGLRPAGVVTVHIWYDGQGEGRICPFIQTTQTTIEWIAQPDLELTPSDWPGWRTYSWRIPDFKIKGTGIQLNDTGASDFVILLDTVSW